MRFLTRWLRRKPQRTQTIADLREGEVVLEGRAFAMAPLIDPIDGSPAVALHYRASANGVVAGITGGGVDQLAVADQCVDFLLTDATGTALIEVQPGTGTGTGTGMNVADVHRRALETYGAVMRVDVDAVRQGARVRVHGVVGRLREGSPHRLQYTVVVQATSFERLPE